MRRGDVVALRAVRRAQGHEQRGARLGVVLQGDDLAAWSTVIVAPTSTTTPAMAFRPEVVVRGTRTKVMVDQLASVDRSRLGRVVGHLSPAELEQTEGALRIVLGLF